MKTHFILKYDISSFSRNRYFDARTPGASATSRKDATKFSSIGDLMNGYATRSPGSRRDDTNIAIIRIDTTVEVVEKEVVTETVFA